MARTVNTPPASPPAATDAAPASVPPEPTPASVTASGPDPLPEGLASVVPVNLNAAAPQAPATPGEYKPVIPPGFPSLEPLPPARPMTGEPDRAANWPVLPPPTPDGSQAWRDVEKAIKGSGHRKAIVDAVGTHVGEIEVLVPKSAENQTAEAIRLACEQRGIVKFGVQPQVTFLED